MDAWNFENIYSLIGSPDSGWDTLCSTKKVWGLVILYSPKSAGRIFCKD